MTVIRTATTRRSLRSLQVMLVAACALALGACGGDDDDSTDGTDGTVTTDEQVETTDAPDASDATDEPVEATDAPDTTDPADVEGVVFTPPDGSYSLVYPSEPTQNDQTVPLPDGTTLPVTFYLLDSGDVALGSAAVEYPPGTEVSLEGARDGAVANISATLIDSEPITLQGRDGLQFSADVMNGQGTYLSRVYVDGATLYQVIDIETGEASFDDPDVAAFFDSFQFAKEG